jgi:hypothetical protein
MAPKPVSPVLIADKATLALSAEELLDGQHFEVRRGKRGLELRIVDGRGHGSRNPTG